MRKTLVKIAFALTLTAQSFILLANNDPCTNVAGNWAGSGNVKLFVFSCGYDAKAVVSEGNPAAIKISVTRTSGTFLCPKTIDHETTASCSNGEVTVLDDTLDLKGQLSEDSTKLDASGTIYALFKKHPVNLSFSKQ